MALPPSDELARWTVGDVNSWLSRISLTAFRDDFLREKIDGSKLMRFQPHEIDCKYSSVPAKKRQILKDCLNKLEPPGPTQSWNKSVPQLPPRPGGRGPALPPTPPTQQDEDSEDGWGSDFMDDMDEDYLEPTPQMVQKPGRNLNGHKQQPPPPDPAEPECVYEIPAEQEEPTTGKGLTRRLSIVDQLKSQLQIRKRDSQVQEDKPPPRPPRSNKADTYINDAPPVPRQRPPPPQPQAPPLEPAEDTYEIPASEEQESGEADYLCPETADMKPNNYLDFSETCKKAVEPPPPPSSRSSREVPLPPRPVKQGSTERAPPAASVKQSSTERAPPPPPQQDDLSSFPWYHGKISRDQAQTIFHREQKDGMFLIRKSERDPKQPYTLVIWHCNRIWNIPIRRVGDKFAPGKFREEETHFASIPELIEHFKEVSLNLKSNNEVQGTHNLTVPAPRK